jgi:vacuolar-type H+-ATPase catalytic subunit A/Vma1
MFEWFKSLFNKVPDRPEERRSLSGVMIVLTDPKVIDKAFNGRKGATQVIPSDKGTAYFVWVPNPVDFNDTEALKIIGHEILHVLGRHHDGEEV